MSCTFQHDLNTAFFPHGPMVSVKNGVLSTNIPGLAYLDELPAIKNGHTLSRLLLTLYSPQAGQMDDLVNAFYTSCLVPLIKEGGDIPAETIRDWLYFHGFRDPLVVA